MSFDRVAGIYDATRSIPDEALERIADRIVAATAAPPQSRFLELGIGTGRIALPLIRRDYRYSGVDISEAMTERLVAKVHEAGKTVNLVHADVTNLPFAGGSFDVVLAVHLLHLVPGWRTALDEVVRVLAPGGYFLQGGERGLDENPGWRIRRRWFTLVAEAGPYLHPDYGTWAAVEEALNDMGAWSAVYRAATWQEPLRPIELLEQQRNRMFSASWGVPDDVLEDVYQRLLVWAAEEFGDLSQEVQVPEEFWLLASRFG